jgi:hypothetical protein
VTCGGHRLIIYRVRSKISIEGTVAVAAIVEHAGAPVEVDTRPVLVAMIWRRFAACSTAACACVRMRCSSW